MSVTIALSTVDDGSMYNRHDMFDRSVYDNRQRFIAAHGADMNDFVRLRVHFDTEDFCRYLEVGHGKRKAGMMGDDVEPADALITTQPGVGLFLPVADCIGAVIYDQERQVLALAHLGRHSLEQQGGTKIIRHLEKTYGCHIKDLQLWLTPAAGKDVYKIWKLDNKGMKEAAFEQFFAAGVTSDQITDNPAETTSDNRYYSYSEYLKDARADDGDHAIIAIMN